MLKTILWTRNTNCFSIFVHRNLRRNGIQNCEYHIVPRPRKWGLIKYSINFVALLTKTEWHWSLLHMVGQKNPGNLKLVSCS